MKSGNKKFVAPIVITIIIILYFVCYFGLLFSLLSGFLGWLLLIIPAVGSILIITVCLERIKEIKGGEENDISKY